MKQLTEFIILSAELDTLTELENNRRTANLASCLRELNLNHKVIEGCYKGSTEISFLVTFKNEDEYNTIKDFGLVNFSQDSILVRNYKGEASLVYGNGNTVSLGKFKQVSEEEATKQDAFSKVDGNYWIVA